MKRRTRATSVALFVVAASLAIVTGAPAPASGAAAGTLTRFAGGFGEGSATGVAQNPAGLGAGYGRLVSVENDFPLPPMGGDTARQGLARVTDLASGTSTVLAGVLIGGYSGDGGPATAAQLNRPSDAAIDAAGNVYITDTQNARIRKVTPAGTISTFAGNGIPGFSGEGAAASSASIQDPTGIAVSPSGDVVFADRSNYRVRKVSPSGTITTIAGTGARTGPLGDGGPATGAVLQPWAVEVDPAGDVYVTDTLHASVRKITTDGVITTLATPPVAMALAVDPSGNVYVDSPPGVVRISPAGTLTTFAGRAERPLPGEPNGDGGPATAAWIGGATDLAFDGGNLYLTLNGSLRIRRIDPAGIITTIAGNGLVDYGGDGSQARGAQFLDVSRIRSGPSGTYIAAIGYDDIRRIDPTGIVSTIYHGRVDGMAVDDAGNVFVSAANRVVRLTPAGALSTVAGTGEVGSTGDGGPASLARLSSPGALAVDRAGDLYVYDHGNHSIRRVDPGGIITTFVGGSRDPYRGSITAAHDTYLGTIFDLAVDSAGALYWSEDTQPFPGGVEIHKAACGVVSWAAGDNSATTGSRLAVDAAGTLYFTADDEVRRLNRDGTVTAVAGSGGSFPRDGLPATSVRLKLPAGIAIQPSGRLLFGDMGRVYAVEGVTAGRANPGLPCPSPDRPLWGSGYNALGQLGDATTTDRVVPATENPPLTGVTAVAGGVGHSLALRADGTVWAWGSNGYGELGDGTTAPRLRPAPVPGLTGVVAVAAGAFHSLALKSDGTVWAWGWNPFGQLGDGTTTQRTRPVPVPGLAGVTSISGGTLHSLAARADGSVWAWGWNGVGQLGDGTTADHRLPSRVPGLAGATSVAAGGLHSLARTGDGSVWAWGWNQFGQLGDGTTAERHVPGQVYGLTDATAVAAGSYHSLALRTGGTVAAWGFGNVGQLGNVSTNSSLTPVAANGLAGAVSIAAGAFHSLARLGDGTVMAWGWNRFGQLATGSADDWVNPVPTAGLDHAIAIGAGAYHSLFAYRLPS